MAWRPCDAQRLAGIGARLATPFPRASSLIVSGRSPEAPLLRIQFPFEPCSCVFGRRGLARPDDGHMTKIAKNQKMLLAGEKEGDDARSDGSEAAPKPTSMFKPRPHGNEDFDPLDLANALLDHEQGDLHPSALADQGDEESINPWRWFHPDGLTLEDVDRQDRATSSVQMGRPRTVFLPTGPVTYLRLTDPLTKDGISAGVGEGSEYHQRARLKLEADTPV
jgi:hypothetical protein